MPGSAVTSENIVGAAIGPRQIFEAKARAHAPELKGQLGAMEKLAKELKPQEKVKAVANQSIDMKKARSAQEKIGIPRDSGDHDKTGADHQERHKKATEMNDVMEEYFNKGYDSLKKSNPTKAAALKDYFRNELIQSPVMADMAAEMKSAKNSTVMDTYLEERMKDDRFRDLVQERFNAAAELGNKLSDTDVLEVQSDLELKREAKDEKVEALARAKAAREANEKTLTDNLDAAGNPIGELKAFKDTQPGDDTDHAKFQTDEKNAEFKMDAMKTAFDKNSKDQSAYDSYKNSYDDYMAKKSLRENSNTSKRLQLEAKITSAQANKQSYEDSEKAAGLSLQKADKEYGKAEVKVKQVQDARDQAEEDYVNALEGSVTEATRDWLQEKADEASELNDQVNEKKKLDVAEQATKDGETKKTKFDSLSADRQQSRWAEKRRGGFIRREKYRYNKKQIDEDYKNFLTNGAEAGTFDIFKQDAASAGIIPDIYVSEETFYEALKENNIDAKSLQTEAASQLMQKKFITGGIPKDESAYIVGTKWGQDALARGLEKNAEFRALLKKIDADGVHKKGVLRRTIDLVKKHPWLLGLLFVGMASLDGTDKMDKAE